MKYSTIIFLGPSLSRNAATAILPDAFYLPPARCGDVLRVLRLKPKKILLIDGYFEHTAAVWHKEILFALESGSEVYGASSMGALRAAELAPFGMQGSGQIYEWYRTGTIIDDDEVAVLHSPATSGYTINSEALVNIRATLTKAEQQELITSEEAAAILTAAKVAPYQERNFKNIITGLVPAKTESLLHNFVDQKKLDAIELLQTISKQGSEIHKQSQLNKSVFLRTLHNDVMCRPFHVNASWLPESEKIALTTRLLGDSYRYLRRLAYLLSAVYAIAKSKQLTKHVTQLGAIPLATIVSDDTAFKERLQCIADFVALQDTLPHAEEVSLDSLLWALIKLGGDYQKYQGDLARFQAELPEYYKLLYVTALLWRALELEALQFAVLPQPYKVQEFFEHVRVQYKLLNKETAEKWLADNDFTPATLTQIMYSLTRFRFLALESNLDCLGVLQECEDVWWYFDALQLTDFAAVGKKMLLDLDFRQATQQQYCAKNPIKNDTDAFALDFVGGYAEFQEALTLDTLRPSI